MVPSKIGKALGEVMFKTSIVPFLMGQKGLGKTSIYDEVRKEYGLRLVKAGKIESEREVDLRFIYIAQMADGGDLLGLPDKRNGITFFARNEQFPTDADVEMGRYAEYGVLVFDEPNRGMRETIQALFQVLVSGELGPHKLASGWRIGLAGNPETNEYIVNTMDEAFWDRVMLIRFENSPTEWAKYAKTKKLHSGLVSFVEQNGELMKKAVIDDFRLPVKPSYRSLEKAAVLMSTCAFEDNGVLEECLMGIIGPEMAQAYLSYEKNSQRKPIEPESLLKSYDGKIKEQWEKILDGGDVDLRNATLESLRAYLLDKESGNTNYWETGEWSHEGLFAALDILPSDVKISYINDLLKISIDIKNLGLTAWFLGSPKSKGLYLSVGLAR